MTKFRAWDKNTERMWDIETWHIADEYVDLIEPGKSIADINAERVWRKQSEIILMQFTGLTDVNGKDIYEGDLVRLADDLDNPYKVIFDKAKFEFSGSRFCYDFGEAFMDCEVIGNVHENPELLEEKK